MIKKWLLLKSKRSKSVDNFYKWMDECSEQWRSVIKVTGCLSNKQQGVRAKTSKVTSELQVRGEKMLISVEMWSSTGLARMDLGLDGTIDLWEPEGHGQPLFLP